VIHENPIHTVNNTKLHDLPSVGQNFGFFGGGGGEVFALHNITGEHNEV